MLYFQCNFLPSSVINSDKDEVHVTPIGDAPTYVNGDLISLRTVLHHVSSCEHCISY